MFLFLFVVCRLGGLFAVCLLVSVALCLVLFVVIVCLVLVGNCLVWFDFDDLLFVLQRNSC